MKALNGRSGSQTQDPPGTTECPHYVDGLVLDASDESVILHSGHQGKNIHGMALVVSKEKARTLADREPQQHKNESQTLGMQALLSCAGDVIWSLCSGVLVLNFIPFL